LKDPLEINNASQKSSNIDEKNHLAAQVSIWVEAKDCSKGGKQTTLE